MLKDELRARLDATVVYPEDCNRIVSVAFKRLGLEISKLEAETIWDDHSEDYCAQWLYLPKDDKEIEQVILAYIENE